MADYRVTDIETVVDTSVWTPPDQKWRLSAVGPGASLGEGRLVHHAGVVLDETFPPPQAWRVVAMAWVDLTSHDDGRYYFFDRVTSLCDWSTKGAKQADYVERSLLAQFVGDQEGDAAQVVTWNGRGFDLPVINLRALKHKIPMGWYYREKDVRYRFTDAGHCDLMDYLGDYGAGRNMKLHDVCRLIGLPGKTGDVSGGSVADVVAKGDHLASMSEVGRYCVRDALQTALIFVRSRFHKGMITAQQHDAAVDSFAKSDEVKNFLDDVNWKGLRVT